MTSEKRAERPSAAALRALDERVSVVLSDLSSALSAERTAEALGAEQMRSQRLPATPHPEEPGTDARIGHSAAESIRRARDALSSLSLEAKRNRAQAAHDLRNAADWERHAMLCVRASDDALAGEALARKAEHDRTAAICLRQADMLDSQVAMLDDLLQTAIAGGPAASSDDAG